MTDSRKTVLLLGSGGLKISQAGEFDYSGSQAIKALKEEGIRVLLINPNIATVQTDSDMADEVYLQPLTVATVKSVIRQQRPDAILLSFGGQTALNLGLELEEQGILAEFGVKVLGTSTNSIRLAEDRALFKAELEKINIQCAQSFSVSTVEEAVTAGQQVGYPLMMRSGFSLGGMGSGIIESEARLKLQAREALSATPEILIEENLIGWSEFEYEIVRDCDGNSITVCNMENFDPMGIHTGESIVVAPSQTLTNDEYHRLRTIAKQVAEHFNIIGECNIQYAYNPITEQYRVIEINPRLSRSSALASKATGYPLAFVATKLALGYKLHQLKNNITQKTVAFFEPALDYVVVKIPLWDSQKLKGANRRIGTEMKSIGEVMAIGRSFPEALQKGVGMLGLQCSCLADYSDDIADPQQEISQATDRRLFALYQYFRQGGSVALAHQLSGIDSWFLQHVQAISQIANTIEQGSLDAVKLRQAKQYGFSDQAIAQLTDQTTESIRSLRCNWQITPVVKQIDTLAGECDAVTNYLYLTYHGQSHDIAPSGRPAVVVLGSGPYRIGSSVEFDWCAVTTCKTLRRLGYPTVLINSNPETVSTDYDESDRLYFEQLTEERVRDIADFENLHGIIVAVGGQAANNLALPLHNANYPILGTSGQQIANAENRQVFSSLLNELDIDQPRWCAADSLATASEFAALVGFPVLIRPSFVLSGAAMNVVYCEQELASYLEQAALVSPQHPVVISEFIQNAKELEIDGVADNGQVVIYAIAEHVENAGVHSGDATIVMPPQRLYLETIRRAKRITKRIVKALAISGPFNIQFIAKDNALRVIECNLRAARSSPFASKVSGYNFIAIATEVMTGHYQKREYNTLDLDYVGVKVPQFSYSRLKGANPVAHVEMASTGEVACLGEDLFDAFYRSWLAIDTKIPCKKIFISIADNQKPKLLEAIKELEQNQWQLYTTAGTHKFLADNNINSHCIAKASDQSEPNATSLLTEKQVGIIINIPSGNPSNRQLTDGFTLRRLAIDYHIPLVTNVQIAQLAMQCLVRLYDTELPAKSRREFGP